jgi:hypothetical protein
MREPRKDKDMSTTEHKMTPKVVVTPSGNPARSLAGRAISRRQALGLAGSALAGVAALASMQKTALAQSSASVVESSAAVRSPLNHYGQERSAGSSRGCPHSLPIAPKCEPTC